jgi:hypothetical protein
VGTGWLVGLPQVGPMCASVRMLVECVAILGPHGMFGFLFWIGVAGGRLQLQGL